MLKVKDIMTRYGVNETTVLGWIAAGELKALNVGRAPGAKRPRWRIPADALAAFEAARTQAAPVTRARRGKRDESFIPFYV